ncbi:hypothetical protein SRHO_G00325930 [Serrasalmus rhombeus]
MASLVAPSLVVAPHDTAYLIPDSSWALLPCFATLFPPLSSPCFWTKLGAPAMASATDALRRQRRRELDARRSKSRIRLGSCLESWGQLKETLGFYLHSELAQYLLDSYFSKVCSRCSGEGKGVNPETFFTTAASIQQLVLLVHSHSQQCPLPPSLQPGGDPTTIQTDPKGSKQAELEVEDAEGGEGRRVGEQEDAAYSGQKGIIKQGKRGVKDDKIGHRNHMTASGVRTRSSSGTKYVSTESTVGSKEKEGPECIVPDCSGDDEDPEQPDQSVASPTGSDAAPAVLSPKYCAPLSLNKMDADDCENPESESAVPKTSKRGRQRRADPSENIKAVNLRSERRKGNRQQSVKDEVSQICSKRKRKAAPKLVLPCEFSGCWKIFSSRQYLNHHMKYQHFQQKTFTCSHPSCGKSFNFKKHLKEHEKLHSDQKDYICEFCARAFRTSSNLSIHRRIHTGEKPLQCEVCGFTCRQKASLNWHMRKHDAESGYQFPCEICGRRFEKRDNVTAHRSKSHPEHLTASVGTNALKPAGQEGDTLSLSENL